MHRQVQKNLKAFRAVARYLCLARQCRQSSRHKIAIEMRIPRSARLKQSLYTAPLHAIKKYVDILTKGFGY